MEKRYALTIGGLHLLAALALVPALFSVSGLVLLVVGIYFFGGAGLDLGYHRLLTHRSFKSPLWLEHALAVIGMCCLQDAPLAWVSAHRSHHAESDGDSDPHSPQHGFWHAHVGWLLAANPELRNSPVYQRFCPDLFADRFYRRLQGGRRLLAIYVLHAAGYAVAGWLWGGWLLAASWLVWGVVVRTVAVWHISWLVNSAAHVLGYRNYASRDDSRNNLLVALLTSGEGFHNNHHAFPSSATNWHRWFEIDGVYMAICVLEKLGLAWDVVRLGRKAS